MTLFRPAFEELRDKAESFFGDGSFDAFEVYRKFLFIYSGELADSL